MDLINQDELKTLIEEQADGICISIYLPTQRAGRERYEENRIRFKNVLANAESKLQAAGLRRIEIAERLQPARQLLDNSRFWAHQSDGLAIFLSAEEAYTYSLPLTFEELVVVGNRFHVKPLLPLFVENGRFYVLALSQNDLRLLQATRHSVSDVELQDIPTSLQEAIKYEDPERELQLHTKTETSASVVQRSAMFHGHGVSDEDKDFIRTYFRQVDSRIIRLLRDEAPLVLAGVDFLLPLYHEVSDYPNLLEAGITGNPESMSGDELHQEAWQVVEPYFAQARKDALARYHDLLNTEQASQQIETVVAAAYYGRVDTLFTSLNRQLWGAFDKETGVSELHQNPTPDNQDLLDAAAVQTLLNGGVVYAVPPNDMPDGRSLAAIFRY